LEGMWKL